MKTFAQPEIIYDASQNFGPGLAHCSGTLGQFCDLWIQQAQSKLTDSAQVIRFALNFCVGKNNFIYTILPLFYRINMSWN